MGTMLIVNAVLIVGIASQSKLTAATSSVTSDNPVVSTTIKSKRDLIHPPEAIVWSSKSTNPYQQRYIVPYSSTSASYEDSSQVATTVNTNPVPNPSQTVTYSPYQYYGENLQNQDPRKNPPTHETTQKTGNQRPLQGNFKVSPANGYPKNAPIQRFQHKLATAGNSNSQYFANPSSYRHLPESGKVATPIKKAPFQHSGNPIPYAKLKSYPAVITNRQYPTTFGDHSFEVLPKLAFNPGSNFNNQRPHINSGQISKSPYKSTSYPGTKNLEFTSPAFSSGISSASGFKGFDNLANYQYGTLPSVGYSNKKGPNSFQLQSDPDLSGFVQSFGNEPVLVSTGINYQTHPSSGLDFDFSKAGPTSLPDGSAPFSSTIGNYQSRILPIHSSSSTPHIPHYKGANVNEFASNEYSTPGNGYQLLANQPQLHFTTGIPLNSGGDRQSVIYHTKPFEEIRTDVEVINKKKPPPPRPNDSDENDFDEGFKPVVRDFGYYPVRNDGDSRPRKVPETETSFDVPTSNLFNSYDEAFGKYSKLASREENANENEKPRKVVHETSKPVHQSIEEEDDGNRDKSSEEYRSGSYTDGEAASGSYEDEDEQESRRSERQDSGISSGEEKEDDDEESAAYKSYGEDYEKEFEDSYRKELPKNDYVHVKEVPDIEEPTSESKKRPSTRSRPKTSRGGSKQKNRHVVQDEQNSSPREYESYKTHQYEEKPKANYRDNEGHGSRTTYKTTTTSSEPPLAESFGYKIPRDRGTSRYTKKETTESSLAKNEPTRSRKPSNTHESQSRSSKPSKQYSSTQKPVTLTIPPLKSIESYTFPPFSSQKSGLKPFRASDSYGAPSFAIQAFSSPGVHREGLRYFTNGQIQRDLSGI